jgi:hypothetical protein
MKNVLVFFLPFFVLFSCKKHEDDTNKLKILKAGIVSDSMVYNFCNFYVEELSLDLNKDSINEINFHTSSDASYFSLLDTSFQILVNPDMLTPKILDFNEPIYIDSLWTNKSVIFNPNSNAFIFADNFNNLSESYIDRWLFKKGYFGIRNEYQKGKFKYGWIKIEIKDLNEMIIYDYAFMQ